jgi:RNA polymerase sigma factor (sigma-70 family)
MDTVWADTAMLLRANARLTAVIGEQRRRLSAFVRSQVRDPDDAEDIVQDVFAELLDAYRMMQPIERVGAWLIRVARNRIIDRFRTQAREPVRAESRIESPDDEETRRELPELLAAAGTAPEAQYIQGLLAEALEQALDELPAAQRTVFIAHELQGKSFRQLSDETGLRINTLLGRKHAAVAHLRRTLRTFYDYLE